MPYKNKEDIKKYYQRNKEKILEQRKLYRKDNLQKIKDRKKRYYKDNCEKIKERVNRNRKQWRNNNPEYYKKYYRNRRRTDIKFNLNHRMTTAIGTSLKRNKNNRGWEELVGYTLKDLIKRLKKTMPEGYIWKDYLKGKLHIDHIIPISAFNFTKPEHFDFKRCWALNNLRLLPAKENKEKFNKLEKPFQPALQICLEEL